MKRLLIIYSLSLAKEELKIASITRKFIPQLTAM